LVVAEVARTRYYEPPQDADFEHSSIPDAVWNTFSLRRDEDIPADLVGRRGD
jgi:hypothetical protein